MAALLLGGLGAGIVWRGQATVRASFPPPRRFRKRTLHDRIARRTHGALWNCPARGRPVSVVPNLDVGEAGAHRPLEVSRATAVDHAGAEGREIPTVPQRIIVADPPRDGQIEDMS